MRQIKDSKISWVGEIPQHWDIRRTKYCFASTKEIAGIRADDYERLALTMNGVIKRSKDDNTGLQPEKFETYQILRPNELVFKLIDLQNISTSRVGLSPYLGLVSPAYIILKSSNGKVLPRFAEKYFLMLWKNQIFNALGDAGVRSSLNIADLLEIPLAFPPLIEQQRIADFLDRECEKIDGLKTDIQAQIDTLEQYKRSVITEAVTHGLNPDAHMKDSGIDYIDKIRNDWKITKIGYVCNKLTRGFSEDDPALICSNNGSVMLRDEQRACGKMVSEDNAKQGIPVGDIAIHGMDTWHGAIGFSKIRGKITRVVHVCDSTEDKRFIVYYLKSLAYQGVYKLISNGVRGNTSDFRSWDKVTDIYICLPNSIEEEKRICDYLDNVIESVDKIIENKKAQLETLDEYKKSLIYEYVTGKKEVVS